jgi:adenylate cyclase
MQNGYMGVTPKPLSQSDFLIEDWLIQPSLNLIVRGSIINHLEPKAMQVLVYLAEHPGEVISKDTFITAVWPDTFVSEQVLTNAIWQIRQAFGEKNKEFIQTIPKNGYRLTAKVLPNWAEFEAGYQSALFQVEESAPNPVPILAPEPPQPVQRKFPVKTLISAVGVVLAVVMAYVFVPNLRPASNNVTIGVLPFKNLSGDPQQEFVSDGMTDELIVQLGNLQSQRLGVIARTTMMTYKDSGKRVDEIGRELGADYILEGGVKRDGDIVRVTANLIEVNSQRQLWSRNYQQASKDISLLQSDIASSIAEQINLRLTPQQRAKLSNPKAVNPAAWDEYQQGMYLLAKFNQADVAKAIEHYRRAAELDPAYAQPHVGLADAYFIMGQPLRYMAGIPPREYLAKSKEEALRAVELDPELASAHSLLATAKFYNDWDWTGAEEEFRKALALDPNSTSAHFYYALFLTFAGRPQEAAPHIRRGVELDPLSLALVTLAAELYMDSRDYDKSFQHVNRVLELDPNFEYARGIKFSLLLNTGKYSEAADHLKKWMTSSGKSPDTISRLERSFAAEGPQAIYKFLLAEIPPDKPIFNFHSAMFNAFLGNRDKAIEFLEKAYQEHDASLLCIGAHPIFDSMRDDPRFRDLTRRIGIIK